MQVGYISSHLEPTVYKRIGSEEIIRIRKMNNLVIQAISASKNSRKNGKKNFPKIKRQFWKLIRQIREEVTLTLEEKEKLAFHINKMK